MLGLAGYGAPSECTTAHHDNTRVDFRPQSSSLVRETWLPTSTLHVNGYTTSHGSQRSEVSRKGALKSGQQNGPCNMATRMAIDVKIGRQFLHTLYLESNGVYATPNRHTKLVLRKLEQTMYHLVNTLTRTTEATKPLEEEATVDLSETVQCSTL